MLALIKANVVEKIEETFAEQAERNVAKDARKSVT